MLSDFTHMQLIEHRLRLAVAHGEACTACVRAAAESLKQNGLDLSHRGCSECSNHELWKELRRLVAQEEDGMSAAAPLPRFTNEAPETVLQSPKLRDLEQRLAQACARSKTQHDSSKVALGKLKETIVNGRVAVREEDLDDPEPKPAVTGRKATVFLDAKKLNEETREFRAGPGALLDDKSDKPR